MCAGVLTYKMVVQQKSLQGWYCPRQAKPDQAPPPHCLFPCGSGGLTSLQKLYGQQRTPGVDWAAGRSSSSSSAGRTGGGSSSRRRLFSAAGATRPAHYAVGSAGVGGVLGQLRYSAYCEASYEVIWKYYAWKLPLPWWVCKLVLPPAAA